MPRERISGRQAEMEVLEKALRSSEPEFVAMYGRRRVGKTFLVREFFGDSICFELTGLHNTCLSDQLVNFAEALGKAMGHGVVPRPPASWREAFRQLEQFLESSPSSRSAGKRVVFLDELPWLDTRRAKFCSALEHFWNSWASRQRDVILVVCGSAASWMIQNVVQARGGRKTLANPR
jgi:predicted AAA+ superfamily ATPase